MRSFRLDSNFVRSPRLLKDLQSPQDLSAGSKKLEELPQLEYGEGPKKWLQAEGFMSLGFPRLCFSRPGSDFVALG